MKFLFIDSNYPGFLRYIYRSHPGLNREPYSVQWATLMAQSFGTSNFYSTNLRALGQEAEEVVVNAFPMQRTWLKEHGLRASSREGTRRWEIEVLMQQLRVSRPDVVYLQDIQRFPSTVVDGMREHAKFVVGQCAYSIVWRDDLRVFDLILSSLPHYVDRFKAQGIRSDCLKLAFEPSILGQVDKRVGPFDVSFVGSFTSVHSEGTRLLEVIADNLPLKVWGEISHPLEERSSLLSRYGGEAWGIDMYGILAASRLTLNRHVREVAEDFANNMRLFEATGVGTCLLTDAKRNLSELFEPGKEVVTYESAQDLVEKAQYLLAHEDERAEISAAGQARTLREHTYAERMEELLEICRRELTISRGRVTAGSSPFGKRPFVERAKEHIQGTQLEPLARWVLWRARRHKKSVSSRHRIIESHEISRDLIAGWQDPNIATGQRGIVNKELSAMRSGQTIPVFRVAADAVKSTNLEDPLLVEMGCASGHYSEVLSALLQRPIRYIGLDYSPTLVHQARTYYPRLSVATANATAIPLRDRACDVLFSSALIMHVPDYIQAVSESFRVSRSFCIFHRTPVSQKRTTYLSKNAYGVPVVELIFNEQELLELFVKFGGKLVKTFSLGNHHVPGIPQSEMKTYVCLNT